MNTFHSLLEQGKLTEIKIAKYFESNGFTVEDLSDDDFYKDIDVDLMIINSNGNKQTLEVKSDEIMHRTGNIFIEHGMDRKTGWCLGWIKKCKAQLLCYHDNVTDVGYILDWIKVKNEITQHYNSTKFWNTTDNCWGWGYLVPIEEAYKHDWIIIKYNLNEKRLD